MSKQTVFALVFCLFGTAVFAQEAADTPRLSIISPLGKLTSARPDESFLAQFETTPVIHAAWGESEALQILVRAPEGGLKHLRAQAGAFSHESGDVWDRDQFDARWVGFVRTEEPYYGTLHVGLWSDPLLPDEEIDIPSGQTRALWLDVTVPLDSEAGRYVGEIRFEAEGWSTSLPLEVMVWGFDMPKSPTLASSFMLFPRYLYDRFGLKKGSAAADAVVRQYHESMLAHRIMPTHVLGDAVSTRPDLRINEQGEIERADFTAFDRQFRWAMEEGQAVFGLDGPKKISPRNEAWYRAVGDHLREMGWIDRCYTYLVDESYEGVALATGQVRRGAPDIKNLITRLPLDGFGDVDWWCPRLGDALMHADEVDAWLAAAGKTRDQLWVYTAGNAGSDVPALHLDVPAIEARITPLAVWKEGYGGLLFWCVNYWTVDPWEDPMVYPRQNGNGALYYPHASGLVESVRLKHLRDGFDDVDYAQMLRSDKSVLAKRILKALPMKSALDWERDPRALHAWRLAAGYYLSGDAGLAASWVEKVESRWRGDGGKGRAVTDLDKPDKGWHGGRDHETVVRPDGSRALRFTLDPDKSKLWRLPSPRNWEGHREILLEIKLVEGAPTRLNLKLGSGLIRRHSWSWELHMAPGEQRRVRIPIPHERVGTDSLSELALYLWEPESRHRFEISGIWIK